MTEREEGRLTLRAIEIFVAVVDAGSLVGGARLLGAAPSTVSQQIAALETSLGVGLVDRAARPFALTAAGRLFHARALSILDQVAQARSELAELDLSAVRELTIALLEDLEGDVLPELLTRLARTFPNCAFVVETGYSHLNIEALERRRADLVVSSDGESQVEGIERYAIIRDPMILITAPGLLEGAADPRDVLAMAPMIRFTRAQAIARQIEAHLRRVRLTAPNRFEVETNKAMMAMVSRLDGWAITTPLGLLSAGWDAARIEACALPFQGSARTLYVCTRRNVLGTLPSAVSAVLRAVLAERTVPMAYEKMPWLGDGFRVLGD